jgi:hypothetical protein
MQGWLLENVKVAKIFNYWRNLRQTRNSIVSLERGPERAMGAL